MLQNLGGRGCHPPCTAPLSLQARGAPWDLQGQGAGGHSGARTGPTTEPPKNPVPRSRGKLALGKGQATAGSNSLALAVTRGPHYEFHF